MIKVEDVEKAKKKEFIEAVANNEKTLNSTDVKAVKKSYWPWILLASTAILAAWYFLLRKRNDNEGIHS